jgi:peptidoglycan biosynthesis protein MviN/MurJ (putative lipid II flippase)
MRLTEDTKKMVACAIAGAIAGALLFWLLTRQRAYHNLEEWEIVRDQRTGRTLGVRVVRRARVG